MKEDANAIESISLDYKLTLTHHHCPDHPTSSAGVEEREAEPRVAHYSIVGGNRPCNKYFY